MLECLHLWICNYEIGLRYAKSTRKIFLTVFVRLTQHQLQVRSLAAVFGILEAVVLAAGLAGHEGKIEVVLAFAAHVAGVLGLIAYLLCFANRKPLQ